MADASMEERTKQFRKRFEALTDEIGEMIVGHREIVEGVLTALFVGGNCLLEGVPGLGKTLLIRTLSTALGLRFARIQFTPDLMPADIIGTDLIIEDPASGRRHFEFQKGPLFHQLILADEINRATPKTQSALLEAMQEHQITVGGKEYELDEPFLVLATQNPLEQEGTYPLPEAQLDRFLFKLLVHYPSREELNEILTRTTEGFVYEPKQVMEGKEILTHRKLVREVVAADHVKDYAVRLVLATHPGSTYASDMVNRYVRWGASPRGGQSLVLGGKVKALLRGRYNLSFDDVKAFARPVLRHRIILNFEGEAEGVAPDDVIANVLENTPTEGEPVAA